MEKAFNAIMEYRLKNIAHYPINRPTSSYFWITSKSIIHHQNKMWFQMKNQTLSIDRPESATKTLQFAVMERMFNECNIYVAKLEFKKQISLNDLLLATFWTKDDQIEECSHQMSEKELIKMIRDEFSYSHSNKLSRIFQTMLPVYLAKTVDEIPYFMILKVKPREESEAIKTQMLDYLNVHAEPIITLIHSYD
ncbi:hypothetical protein [Candidatus Lokiarchaeum ossiferum]|uniref:hypothetical protein n=1 Tax=Candidatus Lokiarchaeum ossiferum TaxID=2951803 RepID=UPI00352C5419